MDASRTVPPLTGTILGSSTDDFVIAEWQDAGSSGSPRWIAPLHLHHQDDEAWYVLEGVLGVKSGNDDFELPAGSGLLVPHGTPHTYWNARTERVRYLLIMTSKIYQLIQAIHEMPDRTAEKMRALFERYDSQLLS